VLTPKGAKEKSPAVVMVAQGGKAGFLRERGDVIAAFLKAGVVVCLVDVRGTGETQPGDASPGRTGSRTSISQTNLILGQPVLGSQLRDLRTVIRWLQGRKDIDGKKLAVWGDSFAKVNAADGRFAVPLDAPELPRYAEPGAALLAHLATLYEDGVAHSYAQGGLSRDLTRDLWSSAYLYVPHDAVVPAGGAFGWIYFVDKDSFPFRFFPPTEIDVWNCWDYEHELHPPATFAMWVAEELTGKGVQKK
jgi:hypothetical protein